MQANWYHLFAALLAAIVPAGLLVTRYELRKVRFRLVEELRKTLFRNHSDLPQLELISARYSTQSDQAGKTRQALVMVGSGAVFFFLVSFAGFSLLLQPITSLIDEAPRFPRITYALLWSMASTDTEALLGAVSVAGVAFLGGFVFQVRYLTRATINQELSALAFVRSTLQLLMGVIVALVVYRVIGEAGDGTPGSVGFPVAFGLAFVFGMFPNLGIARIAKFVRVRTKTIDEDALGAAKLIPLELIDGIDAETAMRLEESNLYDVQNLATVNPISVYAESPFSFLQVFDWVLQAQLCANVGAGAFEQLRRHNIRTIFDLERAVLSEGAPEAYVRAVGGIIFGSGSAEFRRGIGLPAMVTDLPVPGVAVDVETVRHAVAVIADDLHVHRLRTLWRTMLETTAGVADGQPDWLFQTEPLPGDPSFSLPRLSVAAEAFVAYALHMGQQYQAQQASGAQQAELDRSRSECLAAVQKAIALEAAARERLRMQWNPGYTRKRGSENALEPFFNDRDFRATLDPLA